MIIRRHDVASEDALRKEVLDVITQYAQLQEGLLQSVIWRNAESHEQEVIALNYERAVIERELAWYKYMEFPKQ